MVTQTQPTISFLLVYFLQAYDIDAPGTSNSNLKYALVSELFYIHPENGTIFTKVALDREEQERYQVSVVATDNAAAPRSSNMLVTVIVQDVNDNGPVFVPVEYTVELEEESVVENFITLSVSRSSYCLIFMWVLSYLKNKYTPHLQFSVLWAT